MSDRVLTPEPEPGFYEIRHQKGAPRQAVRIMLDSNSGWSVLVNGILDPDSPQDDPFGIKFLLWRWPLLPISEAEYYELLGAAEQADGDHPLTDPKAKVDLRRSKSLF